MKITCLLGGPRENGNGAALAKRFSDTAQQLGATVETFVLNKLNYRGCQGCMACKTKLDRCAQKDDLTAVLDAVRSTDVLVITSPVYMGDVTSTVRAFIERAYSYLVPDFFTNPNPSRIPAGKKLVFMQTQGQANEKLFADLYSRIEPSFKRFGFGPNYLLRACGVRKAGDVENREELLKLAEETARQVMA